MEPTNQETPPRVIRSANLRRGRRTLLDGLGPGDEVQVVFFPKKRQWKLVIESANGVTIRHEKIIEKTQ